MSTESTKNIKKTVADEASLTYNKFKKSKYYTKENCRSGLVGSPESIEKQAQARLDGQALQDETRKEGYE